MRQEWNAVSIDRAGANVCATEKEREIAGMNVINIQDSSS